MIVKNEEARLGNILSEIKDVVDKIVVVDTGLSDTTVSIAQEHGAKVGYFTWCNDFSAARNTSISLATSDYSALEQLLLILDIPLPEAAIDSLAECADLCMKTAFRLKETGEHDLAQHLAEIAVRLDVSSSGAHLFLADLFAEKGDTPRMIASLETALKNGADGDEVLRRIELAEHTSNTTS